MADSTASSPPSERAKALVLLAQQGELGLLRRGDPCRPAAMLSIGVPSASKQRRLMAGRQKAAGEVLQAAAGDDAEAQHDEAGQVAVLAAQAVGDPRAEAGPAGVVDARCAGTARRSSAAAGRPSSSG